MTEIEGGRAAEGGAPPRRQGRPRSPARAKAILEATLDLLTDVGYGGLTMEGVAARAGVAKTTVYRRWPSKPALVVAAAEELAANIRRPDTGTVREDLIALIRDIIIVFTETVAGRIVRGLLSDMAENPDLAEAIGEFLGTRRKIMFEILQRGISRGELRPDIDLELAADMMYGPIYYRFLVRRAPLNPEFADRVVDAVLRGKGLRR